MSKKGGTRECGQVFICHEERGPDGARVLKELPGVPTFQTYHKALVWVRTPEASGQLVALTGSQELSTFRLVRLREADVFGIRTERTVSHKTVSVGGDKSE